MLGRLTREGRWLFISIYDDVFSFAHLYEAERKARKGKRHKKEVILFEMDLEAELASLFLELKERRYRIGGYRHFTIYEPKKRDIQALSFKDRVVQHCVTDNYLMPLLEKHLIYDNAACRKEKGTDFARERLMGFIRKTIKNGPCYVLQFDLHHYFDSIDHVLLKEKLLRLIKDEEMKRFLFDIIDSYGEEAGKGLPMGNQTSQCFALYYLDRLDRIIKEKIRLKCYVRYMDDGVIVGNDKEDLRCCLNVLKNELQRIKLEFNPHKTRIFSINHGITFLGFRYRVSLTGGVFLKLEKGKRRRVLRYLIRNNNTQSIDCYLSYLAKAKQRRLAEEIAALRPAAIQYLSR